MKFNIWYKREFDNRALEHVNLLKEYDNAGRIQARTKHEVVILLSSRDPDLPLDRAVRPLRIGDVLIDERKQAWIYTEFAKWSEVKIVKY